MNFYQAQNLLDNIRHGDAVYPAFMVNKALFLTGDLSEYEFERMDDGMRSAGLVAEIQNQASGTWGSLRKRLVAQNC